MRRASPSRHPSLETMTGYAAGALRPGFGLVVGAHVEQCPHCRGVLRGLEAASGEALQSVEAVAMEQGALEKTLARLDSVSLPPLSDERPLLQRLPMKKRRWVAPGAWVAEVETPRAASDRVYVLHVAAGFPTARHTHDGLEFCTVLSGAFRDQTGLYGPGDFAEAEGDFDHQPAVEGDEACVCLFATEGKLKAKGLIGRMVFAYADV